jgi:hypothetical protein
MCLGPAVSHLYVVGLYTSHQQQAAGEMAKRSKCMVCVLHNQQQHSNMPAAAAAASPDTLLQHTMPKHASWHHASAVHY